MAGLFDRYVRTGYNHAFRLTGAWATDEDVTQATLVGAWRWRCEARLVDGLRSDGAAGPLHRRLRSRRERHAAGGPGVRELPDPPDGIRLHLLAPPQGG